jgi:hypothetical protein
MLHSCTSESLEDTPVPTIITSNYEDQCGSRSCCSYPNNVWAILPVQICVLLALGSTMSSFFSCQFVTIPQEAVDLDRFSIDVIYNGTRPELIVNNKKTTRGLGFVSWENINGECTFRSIVDNPSTKNDDAGMVEDLYWALIGSDWQRPRNIMYTTMFLGSFIMVWVVYILSCISNRHRYRVLLAFVLAVVLPLLQSLALTVLRTELCMEHDCTLGESGHIAIIAVVFYFIAGVLLFFGTTNFPGNPYTKRTRPEYLDRCCCRRHGCERACPNHERADNHNTTVEMAKRHNGFADAVEVPVESEFFDSSLVGPSEPAMLRDGSTTIDDPSTNPLTAVAILSPKFSTGSDIMLSHV